MKSEFEQLLNGLGFTFYEDGVLETSYLHKKDLQELMESVWNMAIEEAANNADADCTICSDSRLVQDATIEVYVIKESILKLKL